MYVIIKAYSGRCTLSQHIHCLENHTIISVYQKAIFTKLLYFVHNIRLRKDNSAALRIEFSCRVFHFSLELMSQQAIAHQIFGHVAKSVYIADPLQNNINHNVLIILQCSLPLPSFLPPLLPAFLQAHLISLLPSCLLFLSLFLFCFFLFFLPQLLEGPAQARGRALSFPHMPPS